ncbi:hypothetical protein C789_3551 [Microcystis aeruginosa FACHB-905 = DIANCHI905]|nr:hypothetical protein C789_3551 [Microcystis aeruginosa FACHB-905 = DIANCHI905]
MLGISVISNQSSVGGWGEGRLTPQDENFLSHHKDNCYKLRKRVKIIVNQKGNLGNGTTATGKNFQSGPSRIGRLPLG